MPSDMGAFIKANADVMRDVNFIDLETHTAIYLEVERHIQEERRKFFEEIKVLRETHEALPWWRRLFHSWL